MDEQVLKLTASADRRLVACEVSSQRTVEWAISAAELPRHANRAPLNIALILDRSGSMQGEKLRNVQHAAKYVLDLLDERDRVALVAYDDQVSLVARSTPVTAAQRDVLKRAVDALRPGGWTDLSGGWLTGCHEVAAYQSSAGVNRALLLTDGLANRGITDVEELAHHASELRVRGVATSAFGVGLGFNEQLLAALAEQGGGHFYYIERAEQIAEVFRRELGELLTVVVREVFVTITVPRGVTVELLGDLPHERVGDRLRIFLGDLCAGERRLLYTRVLTPPDASGASVALAGTLCYADLDGRTATVEATVAFSYAPEVDVLRLPLAEELLRRASEIELAASTVRALRLERAGQPGQARALLLQSLAAAAPYLAAPAAAQYNALAEQMGDGMSEGQRKATHFAAYQARQSRK